MDTAGNPLARILEFSRQCVHPLQQCESMPDEDSPGRRRG